MQLIITKNSDNCPVIGYEINDFEVYNPYISLCGRFGVEPHYYGLTDDQAQQLTQANDILNLEWRN